MLAKKTACFLQLPWALGLERDARCAVLKYGGCGSMGRAYWILNTAVLVSVLFVVVIFSYFAQKVRHALQLSALHRRLHKLVGRWSLWLLHIGLLSGRHSRIAFTNSLSFCMTVFSAGLTNPTALLPQSRDCS